MKNKYKFLQFLIIFVVLFFSGCYAFFQEKIPMNIINDSLGITDLITPEEKITTLDFPTQVFVSNRQYPNKIEVSWNMVPGATSYYIERAVIDSTKTGEDAELTDDKFEIIQEFCAKTSFTDEILKNPLNSSEEYKNIYYYRIYAQNVAESLESENSLAQGGRLLSAPQNVNASKGESEKYINISWEPVVNATEYVIFRTEKSNGTNMEEIASLKSNRTSYQNTMIESERGKEFFYKVSAKAGSVYSATSSLAMGYSLQYGAPVAPTGIKVLNPHAKSLKSLTLSWDALQGSEKPGTKRTVSIYRTSSVDSVYTLVKSGITDSTEFTESSGLKPGIEYYYYLQTIIEDETTGEKLKSAFSAQSAEASGYLLSPPEDISVLKAEDKSKKQIRFKAALGQIRDELDFKYRVYYSDSKDGTYNSLVDIDSLDFDADGYTSVIVENKPFYKLTTLYSESSDGESAFSEVVAPVPEAPVNVMASKTKNLVSVDGCVWEPNVNEVYPVLITWNSPTEGNVPYGYYVYRSSKINSSYKKITDEPILQGENTSFKYIDANDSAKAGQFYYYKVVSLNLLNQGKNSNNPENDLPENGGNRESWGYGAITRDQWFREFNKDCMSSQKKLTLMHKPNDMDKLGSETVSADIPVNGALGTLSYSAKVEGLGADIKMPYSNYADHTIISNSTDGLILLGIEFIVNGNTNTSSNMSANGNMYGTIDCYHYEDYKYSGTIADKINSKNWKCNNLSLFQGMYPGQAKYEHLEIKGGSAGGGYYAVTTYELDRTSSSNGTVILSEGKVDWKVGEESR